MSLENVEKNKLKLYDVYYQSKSIIELLNSAAAILYNPIILTTASYRVIHMINTTGIENQDPIWTFAEKYGYCSSDAIHIFRKAGVTSAVHESDTPIMIDFSVGEKMPRVIHKIKGKKKVIAYLGLFQLQGKITEEDIALIEVLCNILEVAFQADNYDMVDFQDSLHENIIIELLESKIYRMDILQERMSSANWHVQKYFHLLIVPLKKNDSSIYYNSYIQRQIVGKVSISKSVSFQDSLVIIINADNIAHLSNAIQLIDEILVSNDLTATCSRQFDNLLTLSKYYLQTLEMLTVINILDYKESGIVLVDEYLLFSFLNKVPSEVNYTLYICDEFWTIHNYDRKHGTNFEEVILKYIENACNIKKSAKLLFIHRNTMQIKLNQIEEIIGKIDDGQLLFKFYLSSKLLHWKEHLDRISNEKDCELIQYT